MFVPDNGAKMIDARKCNSKACTDSANCQVKQIA